MFKKGAEAKSHQRLSGADKKKLKRTIRDKFPRASDADIDNLLPPKAEITVAKYSIRVHVFSVEGGFPMFFDVDGRGNEIYPSVFALWKVPEMLPSFMLKGGEVSRYIIGGADLMFPGISVPAQGLASFSAGEPWAVKVPGNSAPIAVGSTTMSSSEAIKAGLRGKALRITHYYRDLLWESVEGHYVPNAGFYEDAVFEDPVIAPSVHVSDSSEAASGTSGNQQNEDNNNEVGVSSDAKDVASEPQQSLVTRPDSQNDVEQVAADVGDMKVTENVTADESIDEQLALSSEDVEAYLDRCFLQALHTTVKDKDLPMPGSTFWSNHVLPCRPSGITLDIRKSSHKKLSKWLQAKSSTGLISVKEDKYKKETVLFSINRSHPDYLSFKPEKKQEPKHQRSASESPTSENHPKKILEVAEIHKPSVHVNPIFTSIGADKNGLYSASEASDIVFKYIEKENLVKPTNKSLVVLDPTLCDALFKGTVKKGTTYPTEIHKKDLGSTFVSRMHAHCIVTRGTNRLSVKDH